ncbi:MAG: hypothetical protein KL863_09105 [Rhizobium sp.]|nr:hypothetical protein [Rhizobium sp.]
MNAAQRTSVLPSSLAPIGISREQAAALVGISPSLLDKAIEAGTMPLPRVLGGRLLFDVEEVIAAFRRLPHKAGHTSSLDEGEGPGNPWD